MPPHQQQPEDEDRLSTLPDDILLSILGRLSLRVAARTCVLSTRWRHLPWSLSELSIDVKDFVSVPCSEPTKANNTEESAMVSLTKATRSFLTDQHKQRESTISCLHLKLYLINTFLCEVGPLVGDAIDNGLLKDLDLTVLDEIDLMYRSDEDMLQRAQEIDTSFRAYPSVLQCLTKLSLQNAGFDKLDLHHVLFDCCKQLKHLSLCCCDTGIYSVFKIDAPNSKLCVLEIDTCRFERLELVCLPKLEKFICTTWVSQHVPVTFGFVPSLGELELSYGAICDQPFKLSELLHGTTSIHTLTLDFQGEILWLQPEMEELRTAFNKLKKMCLRGIFVEFDILWTMAFLVAAPSLEKLCIEVWEHACDVGEFRGDFYHDRRTPQWDMCFDGYKNMLLKELELSGFRSLEQQFTFIRSMLERSPNLQKIILRGDEQCEDCDALDASLRPSKFPNKDEEEMVVERIRDGIFSPKIIFYEDCSQLEDEDRLSMLTDDILLCILGRVSLRMAARTCVLSTRWRHLPWLLTEPSIDVEDFLTVPCTEPVEEDDMEEAMASLTKATRSLLTDHQRESTISSLQLTLYLINTFLSEIGSLVGDAIESGLLKDLTVLDETKPVDRSDEEMLQRAQEIVTFFSAYPSVLCCLTKLSLYNSDFNKLDMHHVLFNCCKQLKHLSLCHCDTGAYSVFKIDAPNSKLCVLETDKCRFERIDLVCLPKLEKFVCITWEPQYVPVTFGVVPSLGKLKVSCGATYDQSPFKLSELLHGTSIHTLTLDFQGEILWLQPEMEELRTAFNNLKKLSLRGIFVAFDMLWMTAFLVAAPSLEKLRTQVWEHACDVGEFRGGIFCDRNTPQWEMRFDGSNNRLLKELEFGGFRSLEQQFTFIRASLERSPNLQKIILRGDEDCSYCDALDASLRPSKFPKKKGDQEMVIERIRDDIFSPEIIFDEDWSLSI